MAVVGVFIIAKQGAAVSLGEASASSSSKCPIIYGKDVKQPPHFAHISGHSGKRVGSNEECRDRCYALSQCSSWATNRPEKYPGQGICWLNGNPTVKNHVTSSRNMGFKKCSAPAPGPSGGPIKWDTATKRQSAQLSDSDTVAYTGSHNWQDAIWSTAVVSARSGKYYWEVESMQPAGGGHGWMATWVGKWLSQGKNWGEAGMKDGLRIFGTDGGGGRRVDSKTGVKNARRNVPKRVGVELDVDNRKIAFYDASGILLDPVDISSWYNKGDKVGICAAGGYSNSKVKIYQPSEMRFKPGGASAAGGPSGSVGAPAPAPAPSSCQWKWNGAGMSPCPEVSPCCMNGDLNSCKAKAKQLGANGIQIYQNRYCRLKKCSNNQYQPTIGRGVELRWRTYYCEAPR